MKTKLLSLFAAIVMAATASAQFSGSGSGTASDPYLIFNPIQLDQVRNFLNNENVYFKMMADVDLKEFIENNNPKQGWLPIGTSTSPFKGHFDGNKKKIFNMSINRPSTDNVGFFGYCLAPEISNTYIEGDVVGHEAVGMLIGYLLDNSSVSNHTKISYCSSSGKMKGQSYVGGIIGTSNIDASGSTQSIERCSFEGDMETQGDYLGGIVGYANVNYRDNSPTTLSIIKCNAVGVFSSKGNNAGGIVGYAHGKGYYYDYFHGGYYSSINVSCCYVTSSITALSNVGGIIGYASGVGYACNYSINTFYGLVNIENCYFDGKVHGKKYIGGVTGYTYNTKIYNSYSRANIVASDYCGGIAGMLEKNTEVKQNIAINNIISTETGTYLGRIIASWNTPAEYYNTIGAIGTNETNKALNTTKVVIRGIQKTDIDDDLQNGQSVGSFVLKYKATYQGIGWDFTNIWDMQETENYPYFQWQAAPPIINSAKSGETTVMGKGSDGATIEVTIGDSTYQTTCSGNNWSVTVDALVAGSTIYARAKTADKEYSYRVSQRVAYLGAGTEADPYKIYTAEELENINGVGNYKVMNDIDLSTYGDWTPIGQYETVTANVDGDNHTISGLSINTKDDYQGLFAQCDGSEIKNIKLTVSTLTGGNYTGALVSKIVGGEIINCQITGNVSSGEYTGGLVGYSQDTKIAECSFKGNVVGTTFVGGLAAFASGEVYQSQYQGEVSSTTASAVVGGLIGNNNANISECLSIGKATCTASNSMVGGLVGRNNDTIINCYSETEISANQYAGGLVGYNYRLVQYCYAKGNITSTSVASGLVGYNDGMNAIVKNCSAMNPSINATSSTGIAIRVIGGIKNSAPTPEMNNYALKTMAVSVNGIAQTIYDDNLHGVSKTDAVLKQGVTYSGLGWNMSTVWGIKEGASYPYLQFFYMPVITVNGLHGTVTGGGSYKPGTSVTITAVADPHYTFVKWSDGNTQATRTIIVTGDATYTAEFKADQFTVNASATNGTITGTGTYDYGTKVTLTVVPNAHYHLVQWSDGLTTLSRTLTVTQDSTLSAECAIDQYTITVEGQNGTVSGGGTYAYNTSVTLTAIAKEGYSFQSWDDGNSDNPRTLLVTDDVTLIATFVPTTGLEETSFPSGEDRGEAAKFIRDNQLLILRDGKTYNAQGAEVR